MSTKVADPAGPEDFSLVLGGPLYQMYLRSGLLRPPADADIQSLADLAGAHDVLREMRLLPFGRQTIVGLAVVIALPYLPLTLTMIPFEELLTRIIGKLL